MKKLQNIWTVLIIVATTIGFVMTSCEDKNLNWEQLSAFRIYDHKTFPQDKDFQTFTDGDFLQVNFVETNLEEIKNNDRSCQKCDLETLKTLNEHLDNLTFKIISDFVCTFDLTCKNNIEYSEWSNELLFKVLDKSPKLLFEVLGSQQYRNKEIVINEVKSPVLEIDFQNLYDKVKIAPGVTVIRAEFLTAIITAAEKSGQKIIK